MSRVGSILRVITRSLLAFTVFIPTTWVGLFATDHLVARRGLWPEVLDSWLWWVILGVPVLFGIAAAVLVDRVLRRMRERSRVLLPGAERLVGVVSRVGADPPQGPSSGA